MCAKTFTKSSDHPGEFPLSTDEQDTKPADGESEAKPNPLKEITQPFVDLVRAPRALWGINAAFLLEGMVYFGMLMYLAMYFNEYVGLGDSMAGIMVGVLTSGITFSMFLFGGLADKWGVRIALILSFLLMIVGRIALSGVPTFGLAPSGLWSPAHLVAMGGILLILLGYGMYQPAAYSGVRQLTTPKTAAMGFAMLYALMNLGGWIPSFFPPIRKAFGIAGTYWVFTGASVVALLLTVVLLSKKVVEKATAEAKAAKEAAKSDEQKEKDAAKKEKDDDAIRQARERGFAAVVWHWLRHHPLADAKFSFFIFALIPVQTLFAHNWLTLPVYVERAYAPAPAIEACEQAKPTPESDTAFKEAESGKIESWNEIAEKHEGTRAACVAKKKIREVAKTKPAEGEKFDAETAKRVEKAGRTIRTLDYEAASKAAWEQGKVSEVLRLWLGENYEVAVNFNPLLIFILVPIVTALTQKRKVYNMMIVGTFVMGAPTFLLAFGASFWTLLGYLLVMTVGEAMWQPRFLQYAAEIAPEGKTAAYMGVAQFPWFLTKMLVPLYSGYFLATYVPEEGRIESGQMWLIYGVIAMSSTVMLVLAKRWVGKDFKTKAD